MYKLEDLTYENFPFSFETNLYYGNVGETIKISALKLLFNNRDLSKFLNSKPTGKRTRYNKNIIDLYKPFDISEILLTFKHYDFKDEFPGIKPDWLNEEIYDKDNVNFDYSMIMGKTNDFNIIDGKYILKFLNNYINIFMLQKVIYDGDTVCEEECCGPFIKGIVYRFKEFKKIEKPIGGNLAYRIVFTKRLIIN